MISFGTGSQNTVTWPRIDRRILKRVPIFSTALRQKLGYNGPSRVFRWLCPPLSTMNRHTCVLCSCSKSQYVFNHKSLLCICDLYKNFLVLTI